MFPYISLVSSISFVFLVLIVFHFLCGRLLLYALASTINLVGD